MLPDLNPGDTVRRREVHALYGGREQGGIGPSRRSNVVLFFTDPVTGHQHGYYDGWGQDGFFHYVGEGQRGDQRLVQGNKAIVNHRADGRTLEGFRSSGPLVTYLGEFDLVAYYFTDAHETGNPNTIRQVVVFKLRPLSPVPVELPHLPISPAPTPRTDVVTIEDQYTERAFVAPDRELDEIERSEEQLVARYTEHLERAGHKLGRHRIVPPGESRPLYSDLWDETKRELIEAKGTVARDQIRLAVGQLLDYGRFVDAKFRSILLPSCPREDMLDYLQSAGIGVIFPEGDGWQRIDPEGP